MLQNRGLTQTSRLAVIMASIVPIRICICKSEHRHAGFQKGLALLIATSKVLSSNVKSRMSITSPGAATHSDFRVLDLERCRRERHIALPADYDSLHDLLDHDRRILHIREQHQCDVVDVLVPVVAHLSDSPGRVRSFWDEMYAI